MKNQKGITLIALLLIIITVLACIVAFKVISNKNSTKNTNGTSISNTSTNNNSSTNINSEIKKPSDTSSNTNSLGKEFKQAMDSYEETMDAYIAFMVKYTNSKGTDPQLFKDYAEWLKKYANAIDAFEKWENNNLNKEEAKYYVEVQTRVTQKLINASIDVQYQ